MCWLIRLQQVIKRRSDKRGQTGFRNWWNVEGYLDNFLQVLLAEILSQFLERLRYRLPVKRQHVNHIRKPGGELYELENLPCLR